MMTVSPRLDPPGHQGDASWTLNEIPRLAFTPLPRNRLVVALDDAVGGNHGGVLLICSPVGTGKTVLVAEWAAQQGADAFPGGLVWQTMEDDPQRLTDFWQRLRISLGLPPARRGPLAVAQTEAAEIARELAERAQRTLVVIDDAHLATDPALLTSLEHFLLHAPACLTTIIAARFEPPLRWHLLDMSSQLRRWNADDLAFSATEIDQVCREQGCSLAESEVIQLMNLTQGWAALVRMAAIYLSASREEPAAALTALARPPSSISDLLAGELIETLPPGIRLFLTYTSVPAEFTDKLADGLIGGGATHWLHELTRMNYPLTSMVRDGEIWFTYHPMLRAYFLAELNRVGPDATEELHLRTSLYLQSIGRPAAALPHVLTVRHRPALVDFLAEHALGMTLDGHLTVLLEGLATLEDSVPTDPFSRLLHIVDALSRIDLDAARAAYDTMNTGGEPSSELVPAHVLTALTMAVDSEMHTATGIVTGADPIELPPTTGQPDLDCYVAVESATALLARGDLSEGERRLHTGLAVAGTRAHPRLRLRALARLAMAAGISGALTVMRQRARAAMEFAYDHDLSVTAEALHATAMAALGAYIQGDRYEIDSGTEILGESQLLDGSLAPKGGLPTHIIAIMTAFDTTADKSTAAGMLKQGFSRLLDTHPAVLNGGLLPLVVWDLLWVRDSYEAQLLVEQARSVLGEPPEIVIAQAALAADVGRWRTVLDLVDPLLAATPAPHPTHVVTAWLLHAHAHHELGSDARARQGMESALRYAATERIVRPFLDVPGALTLLDAFTGSFGRHDAFASTLRRHPLVRRHSRHPTLTGTELKVLRNLPSGRTTQQIADDLGVSVNTIKTHLRGIYSKLGTNSRMDVVAEARRCGLL
ncbi:LuxR C-terminal-related transcriptional regulator [Nocardia sp. NPDC050406]|uniref:LuxR C-terminal-related transcriptional regulator n=1 Tax=Nocardia sp. NPDC050406 TaxID=3364318 RepID=UPI0037AB639B